MQRSILAQLSNIIKASQPLQDLHRTCHQSFPPAVPTSSQLQEAIHDTLKQVTDAAKRNVHIVVDGLDEVSFGPPRDAIITAIQDIAELRLAHVKLLIFSRPEDDISEAFHTKSQWKQQAIPRQDTNRDIETFVENEMARHSRLGTISEPSKSQIKSRLLESETNM